MELIKELGKLAQSKGIQKIVSALDGHEVFIVGGIIRELASGKGATDLDLAVASTPDLLLESLESANLRVIATGIEHGTVTVVHDKQNIEITCFRLPGPRNQPRFSDSIETDLAGRDFTINAIAYSIKENKLYDPFKGLSDLEEKALNAVGDASQRIQEDPLRILRAIRFGPSAGRKMSNELLKAISEHATSLKDVSIERIQSEFNKILVADNISESLNIAKDSGVLEHVIPELLDSVDFEQNDFHTEDVFSHTLTVLSNCNNDLTLRLAALFHDIGKPASLSVDEQGKRHFYKHEQIGEEIAKNWLMKMKYSKAITSAVPKLVALHMRPLDCGPSGVRRIIRDTEELFDTWLALKKADKPPIMTDKEFSVVYENFTQMVEDEKNRIVGSPFANLAIGGEDLKKLGMQEGVQIGQMLTKLQDLVLETPELNTSENLLEKAKSILENSSTNSE